MLEDGEGVAEAGGRGECPPGGGGSNGGPGEGAEAGHGVGGAWSGYMDKDKTDRRKEIDTGELRCCGPGLRFAMPRERLLSRL